MSTHDLRKAAGEIEVILNSVGRHCIRCGKTHPDVVFSSARALKCDNCKALSKRERKAYDRSYQVARDRAMQTLISNHYDEWRRILADAHEQVKNEATHGNTHLR